MAILSDIIHNGPMVSWLINHKCNFRCEYCFFSEEFRSIEDSESGIYSTDHIFPSFNNTGETWWIYITGGEPFLYPNFVELCEKLTQNHFITINTNLSTSNTKFFAERIDPTKVYSINAALHILEREKKGGVNKFIDVVNLYQEKGFEVRVEYVVYPSLINRLNSDFEMLKQNGVKILNIKTFRGKYNNLFYPSAYNDDERRLISNLAIDKVEVDLVDKKLSFFGKNCSAGKDFFTMNPGGDLRRCSTGAKTYGNIFKGTFVPDQFAKPCPFPYCGCPYEGLEHTSGEANYNKAILEIVKELPSFAKRKLTYTKIKDFIKRRFF